MSKPQWLCWGWLGLLFGLAAWREVVPVATGVWLIGLGFSALVAPAVAAWLPLFGAVFVCLVSGSQALYFFVPLFVLPLVVAREEPSVNRWTLLCVLSSLPIAVLSGGAGGASGWAEWLMANFGWNLATADAAVWWIRKSIHFLVYGWVAWTAAKMADSLVPSVSSVLVFGLLWGCAHGAFDELRQSVTPGRTGRVEDLLVNFFGAVAFLAIWWQAKRRVA